MRRCCLLSHSLQYIVTCHCDQISGMLGIKTTAMYRVIRDYTWIDWLLSLMQWGAVIHPETVLTLLWQKNRNCSMMAQRDRHSKRDQWFFILFACLYRTIWQHKLILLLCLSQKEMETKTERISTKAADCDGDANNGKSHTNKHTVHAI